MKAENKPRVWVFAYTFSFYVPGGWKVSCMGGFQKKLSKFFTLQVVEGHAIF